MGQIVLGPTRAYPNIPTVGDSIESHTAALNAIVEALNIAQRRTNSVLDSFVRVRELETLGLANITGSVITDSSTEESTTHHHDLTYLKLDGTNDPVTGLVNFDGGLTAANATITGTLDVSGATYVGLSSDDLSDRATIAMLDENEIVLNPWQFDDDITMGDGVAINWLDTLSASTELLAFTALPTGDPYWANVTLLLDMAGTDGVAATTDLSSSPKTVTFQGGAVIDNAQAKFSTTSCYFDNVSGTYLSLPTATFNPGASDFTVECHVMFNDTSTNSLWGNWTTSGHRIALMQMSTSGFNFYGSFNGATTTLLATAGTLGLSTGVWYHVAVAVEGTAVRVYVDGVEKASTTSKTSALNSTSTTDFRIGQHSADVFNGWIDNFRVTVGTARYTTAFTPPTAEYPTTSGGVGGNQFSVGDPAYDTIIDGLTITLNTASLDLTGVTALDVTGVAFTGLSSDDLSDVASIGMLDEAETVLSTWAFSSGLTSAARIYSSYLPGPSSHTDGTIVAGGNQPVFIIVDENGTANNRAVGFKQAGTSFTISLMSDVGSFGEDIINISRSGNALTVFNVGGGRFEHIGGDGFDIRDGSTFKIYESGDFGNAAFRHDSVDFNTTFTSTTDWNISGITAIQAGTVDADFDAITATSYGGILEANLVDKSAAEIIPGAWDFTGSLTVGGLHLDDSENITLGTGNDVSIYFDGAAEILYVDLSATSDFFLRHGTDTAITAIANGAVSLAYDNVDKLATTSIGIDVTGTIQLSPQAAPSHNEGLLWYDSTEKALSYYNDEVDVTINVGQENVVRVRNTTGVTITNGSAVYISGATGANLPNISLAQANALDTSRCIGLATHDIEHNSNGYVTTLGLVRDLNTSAYSAGDTLYLSTSVAGGLQNTRPTTGWAVVVGKVTISNVSVGEIKVLSGLTVQQADLTAASDNETISGAWKFTNAAGLEIEHATDAILNFDSVTARLRLAGVNFLSSNAGTVNIGPGGSTYLAVNSGGIDVTGDVDILAGNSLKIYDTTGVDSAEFSHDGTDFNTAFTTTTDWNITGLTKTDHDGRMVLRGASVAGDEGSTLVVNSSNCQFTMDFTAGGVDMKVWNWINTGNTYSLRLLDDAYGAGDTVFSINRSGAATSVFTFNTGRVDSNVDVWVRDGSALRVYDSTDTDYAAFSHDGTDFNTAFTNTTDWNLTGLTQLVSSAMNIILGAGRIEAGWIYAGQGGTGGLRVYDAGGTDYISVTHDGTDLNAALVNTVDVNFTGFTTDFVVGNYRFNANQTVGVGQDNYVLTYDNATGKIGLEAATGGGLSASDNTTITGNWGFQHDTIGDFMFWRNGITGAAGIGFRNDDGVKGYVGFGDDERFVVWNNAAAVIFAINNAGSISTAVDGTFSGTLTASTFNGVGGGDFQGTGLSTTWGTTSGVNTGAYNAVMGVSSSATWLISGTSSGGFRGGIQLLDTGGAMRLYVSTAYLEYNSSNELRLGGSNVLNDTKIGYVDTMWGWASDASTHNFQGSTVANASAAASSIASTWSNHITQWKSGAWDINGGTWMPDTGWWWCGTFAHTSNTSSYNYSGQIAFQNNTTPNVYFRTISGGTPGSWYKAAMTGLAADITGAWVWGNNNPIQAKTSGGTATDMLVFNSSNQFVVGHNSYKLLLNNDGVYIKEKSSDATDIAAYGQFWVKSATPNIPIYTDDAGGDYYLGYAEYKLIANQSTNMNTSADTAWGCINAAWYSDNVTAYTLTLENSTGTNFPVGAQMTIWNEGSGTLTISEGTGTTLYLMTGSAVTDTAGGCTMAQGGYATLIRKSSTVYLIMGSGLTA